MYEQYLMAVQQWDAGDRTPSVQEQVVHLALSVVELDVAPSREVELTLLDVAWSLAGSSLVWRIVEAVRLALHRQPDHPRALALRLRCLAGLAMADAALEPAMRRELVAVTTAAATTDALDRADLLNALVLATNQLVAVGPSLLQPLSVLLDRLRTSQFDPRMSMAELQIALFRAESEGDPESLVGATAIATEFLQQALPAPWLQSCISWYAAADHALASTRTGHISSSARLVAITLDSVDSAEDAENLLQVGLRILNAMPRRCHNRDDLLLFAQAAGKRFGRNSTGGLMARLLVGELLTDLAAAQHNPTLCDDAITLLPPADLHAQDDLAPIFVENIARARSVRYQLTNDVTELHRAIFFVRQSADGHPVRGDDSLILRRLAILTFMRYRTLGYLQDLNESITFGELIREKGPDDGCYVDALVNLSAAYRQQYLITDDDEALQRAIASAETVLGIAETSAQVRRAASFNLDICRMHKGDDRDPEASIRALLRGVEEASSRTEAARRAIAAAQIALGATGTVEGASLGGLRRSVAEALVLAVVGLTDGAPELPTVLIQIARLAKMMDGPASVTQSALQAALTLNAYRPLDAITMLTAWADEQPSCREAELVAAFLPDLVRSLFFSQLNVSDRLMASKTGTEISIDISLVLARHGEVLQAVDVLETTCGSLIRERMGMINDDAGDDPLERAVGVQYRTVTSGTGDRWEDSARFERFATELGPNLMVYPPPVRAATDLNRSMGSVTAVILACGRRGSGALILGAGREHPGYIDLPDFNRAAVEQVLSVYRQAYARRRVHFSRWLTTLDDLSVWLGKALGPVLREIPVGSALALVPLGGIGTLPIGAAATDSGYMCELYDLTISPNLTSVTRPCVDMPPEDEVLIVSTAAGNGNAVLLETEGRLLSRLLAGSKRLVLNRGQRDTLVAELQRHTWVHLACHAHSDPAFAEKSYLLVGEDSTLPLRQLGLSTFENTQVVVLSGCETGVSTDWAPSEFWGMTGAMLSGGVRRVLASSWAVDDATTLSIMLETYQQLLAGAGHHEALRRAQSAVRHGTVRTEWLEQLNDREAAWIRCGGAKHPYYWASHGWYGSAVAAPAED